MSNIDRAIAEMRRNVHREFVGFVDLLWDAHVLSDAQRGLLFQLMAERWGLPLDKKGNYLDWGDEDEGGQDEPH